MPEGNLFVGYGSLLSARGLGPVLKGSRGGRLLHLACGRRFGKPPQKGGRLAMEVVSPQALYRAEVIDPRARRSPAPGECGALLLEVTAEAEPNLVRREGFDSACWARLRAQAGPAGVGELLARVAADAGDDPLAYRRELWERAGTTKWSAAHYVPHPVRLADGRAALVFVAPEPGETGHPSLPSCKESHPGLVPALLDRVFEVGPGGISDWESAKQDHYVQLCLLSLAHGVFLGDLLGEGLSAAHPTRALLAGWQRDPTPLLEERRAVEQAWPGSAAGFAPDLATAWEWSGLRGEDL